MQKLIVVNGTIVTSQKIFKSDVLVVNGKIKQIGKKIKTNGSECIVDAAGCYVMPGAIDPHVHFELPTPAGKSADDFYSGSRAAIAGGVTTIIDFVTPSKGQSFLEALEKRKAEAKKSLIDYSFHMSPTWWDESCENEFSKCVHEQGINSFKVYLAYKGAVGIDDKELADVMWEAKKHNAMVTLHCENGDLIKKLQNQFVKNKQTSPVYHALSRPDDAEAEAVFKAIAFARVIGCKIYIVHVSSAKAMNIIIEAKKEGLPVYAETCPHYLILDDSVYNEPINKAISYVLSPPLRKVKDQNQLWEAIKKGFIDVVATDHCPFNAKGQKDVGLHNFTRIPNGGNGVEERLSLLFNYGVLQKKISLRQFVNITSTQAAKIFGLYPQKGNIEVGADADLVIFDPEISKKISSKNMHTNCDSNIYDGYFTTGWPKMVISNGELVYNNHSFADKINQGKYLKRLLIKGIKQKKE